MAWTGAGDGAIGPTDLNPAVGTRCLIRKTCHYTDTAVHSVACVTYTRASHDVACSVAATHLAATIWLDTGAAVRACTPIPAVSTSAGRALDAPTYEVGHDAQRMSRRTMHDGDKALPYLQTKLVPPVASDAFAAEHPVEVLRPQIWAQPSAGVKM